MQMAGQSSMNLHFGFEQHCCRLGIDVHLNGEHQAFLNRQGKASFPTDDLSASSRGRAHSGEAFVAEGTQWRLWDVKMCMSSEPTVRDV